MQKDGLTYATAGVDIDAGNALVDRIRPAAARTSRAGAMDGIGGFGALFDLKAAGFSDPVLVAATDGVGTKLRIAIETGEVAGVGTDLVAMCVNDLVCQGAEPLFFLDYFATARLDIDVAAEVVEGIAQGCLRAGAALIGGETAEMPGMYADGDFDLAGFAVGAMERGRGLPREIGEGDTLIAIASSGVHSNGFSLVRRVVEKSGLDWTADCPWGDGTLGQGLLTPTEIYVAAARAADATDQLRGLAHITGGGLTENLPRILPEGLGARVDLTLREVPSVFRWLAEQGGIDEAEMRRTFNCGIGMIAVAPSLAADSIVEAIRDVGHDAWVVGKVTGEEGIAFDGELF